MNWSDIYLIPAPFCSIASRKDVDPSVVVAGTKLQVPIIASNMDTVYTPKLAHEAAKAGAIACVHRFCTIDENVKLFLDGIYVTEDGATVKPWVSVGINDDEFLRAEALIGAGAEVVLIDVANAACEAGVRAFRRLKEVFRVKVVVGNFATHEQIEEFIVRSSYVPDAVKISVGSGSMCLTEKYTVGAGLPPVQCVLSCKKSVLPMIFDGGMDSPASYNKALALGCVAVMCGKQFAGTYYSAGVKAGNVNGLPTHSYYRGSAAADSYAAQGKTASWRPVEGKGEHIPITGDVATMLQSYEAALRSAMTYSDARTMAEYHEKVQWGVKSVL